MQDGGQRAPKAVISFKLLFLFCQRHPPQTVLSFSQGIPAFSSALQTGLSSACFPSPPFQGGCPGF